MWCDCGCFQDTISVHRPGFYSQRFQTFFTNTIFKKIPSRTQLSLQLLKLVYTADKTVLPCLCRWCELNCRQDKTVLSRLDPVSNFQVFCNPRYIWDWTVANWKLGRDKTKLSCLVHVGGVSKLLMEVLKLYCIFIFSSVQAEVIGVLSDLIGILYKNT